VANEQKRPIVIAEAGVNHNGDINLAMQLVDIAASAGADYVKFQTFKAEKLATYEAEKAPYQHRSAGGTQLELLKALELSYSDFERLSSYAKRKNLGFLSTAFDLESLAFVISLRPDFLKIPSGEITNIPLLKMAGSSGIPVIMSTGMSDITEVSSAVKILLDAGLKRKNLILLQCSSAYPAPISEAHLRVIPEYAKIFKTKVGYSDHTLGVVGAIAAVALGAVVIEKHFTLDKDMNGPDHAASLDPEELSLLISSLEDVVDALGSPSKSVTPCEFENRKVVRRSIVAAKNISKGSTIGPADLVLKRPGFGLPPNQLDDVIGSVALRDISADELLDFECFSR
jgi:N,N'-diacetyllegionaminate synthase